MRARSRVGRNFLCSVVGKTWLCAVLGVVANRGDDRHGNRLVISVLGLVLRGQIGLVFGLFLSGADSGLVVLVG